MHDKLMAIIKQRWLALAIVAAVLILSSVVNNNNNIIYGEPLPYAAELSVAKGAGAEISSGYIGSRDSGISSPPIYHDDFAPDAPGRQIERDAYLSLEIKRGKFEDSQKQLREMIAATESLLLYENVNSYGDAYYGSYTIKVKAERYNFFLTQVRELGKVLSLTDNARDVTGQVENLQQQFGQAKEELSRLKALLKETENEPERIKLQQQISDQERYLGGLQSQLDNQKDRVEYFTVSVNLQEAPSGYQGVELINFSELVRKLVISFNALLRWLFGVFPWAVLGLVVWLIVRVVKRRA